MPFEGDPIRLEIGCQLLHQINRPMLTPGTPDGNSDVATVMLGKGWQPALQERLNVGKHSARFWLRSQERSHGVILASQIAQ